MLTFFLPLQDAFICPSPQSSNARQKQPVSSMFQIYSAVYSLQISGSLSFQESTVAPLTSPDSPHITSCLMLCFLFHLSNQPLDALNSLFPMCSAISQALIFNMLRTILVNNLTAGYLVPFVKSIIHI